MEEGFPKLYCKHCAVCSVHLSPEPVASVFLCAVAIFPTSCPNYFSSRNGRSGLGMEPTHICLQIKAKASRSVRVGYHSHIMIIESVCPGPSSSSPSSHHFWVQEEPLTSSINICKIFNLLFCTSDSAAHIIPNQLAISSFPLSSPPLSIDASRSMPASENGKYDFKLTDQNPT